MKMIGMKRYYVIIDNGKTKRELERIVEYNRTTVMCIIHSTNNGGRPLSSLIFFPADSVGRNLHQRGFEEH